MLQLPHYIPAVFVATALLTVFLFFKASRGSVVTLLIILGWMALQGLIAFKGFYTKTDSIPPRFFLTVVPALLCIIILFVTGNGRQYVDSLDLRWLTLLHTIRIPVELVLLWLSLHKAVPQLMTFEGRNFDILSGLTASIIYALAFSRNGVKRKLLLVWNFVCLALLINIVVLAVLSAPFPFQRLAFEQPNIAVLYFPFVWLPCCVVPLVLLSHLAAINQLLRSRSK